MTKTLNIMRHAKSDWGSPGQGDFDRGLNGRGQRDAPRMGAALAEFVQPQSVAASAARRAQQTLVGVMEGWPELADKSHLTEQQLYTFSSSELLSYVAARADDDVELFLLGHNPGMTDLVNILCGRNALDNLPTAGFVRLQLDIESWSEIAEGCGDIERYLFPKQLS